MANPDLENVLKAVSDQLRHIEVRWKIYGQLFDSGPANVELLNKSGSYVFWLFQQLILDDVIIALSRLTDPEKFCRKREVYENASIKNLVAKAKTCLSATAINDLEDLIEKLDKQVLKVREHRDKALAHADLIHASGQSALTPIEYKELDDAMETIREIFTKVAKEACGWDINPEFKVIIPFGCGGDSLLKVLKRGHSNETKG